MLSTPSTQIVIDGEGVAGAAAAAADEAVCAEVDAGAAALSILIVLLLLLDVKLNGAYTCGVFRGFFYLFIL